MLEEKVTEGTTPRKQWKTQWKESKEKQSKARFRRSEAPLWPAVSVSKGICWKPALWRGQTHSAFNCEWHGGKKKETQERESKRARITWSIFANPTGVTARNATLEMPRRWPLAGRLTGGCRALRHICQGFASAGTLHKLVHCEDKRMVSSGILCRVLLSCGLVGVVGCCEH